MRACRDTFLHLLADNLTSRTIHPIRRDKDDPSAGELASNAINVHFITDDPRVQVGSTNVSIDVVYENELDAIDAVRDLFTLLSAQYMTPKLDYSSGSPSAVGTNLIWNPQDVKFRTVFSDFYFHYSCTLPIKHHPI
jgi:hypothetical protein